MQEKLTLSDRMKMLKTSQIVWPLVILIVIFGIGLGIYNYQKGVTANQVPTVSVKTPVDNTTVSDEKITLSGTVQAGDTVTINDKTVTVNSKGEFSTNVALAAGKNTITIVTTGTNGKSKIITRQVTREIPVAINTTAQVSGTSTQAAPSTLTNSGPETNYVISAGLISAAIVGWYMTKKNLSKALIRR